MRMKTKIVLDTNVFLYALDDQNIYHSKSKAILYDHEYLKHTTTKNISEYFAVASKLNIEFDKAFAFYEQFCNNTIILFPTHKSLSVFETLMQKYQPRGNKIYDLEIISIALSHQVKYISTFNTKDFIIFSEIILLP